METRARGLLGRAGPRVLGARMRTREADAAAGRGVFGLEVSVASRFSSVRGSELLV